jgi:hypothetical protein
LSLSERINVGSVPIVIWTVESIWIDREVSIPYRSPKHQASALHSKPGVAGYDKHLRVMLTNVMDKSELVVVLYSESSIIPDDHLDIGTSRDGIDEVPVKILARPATKTSLGNFSIIQSIQRALLLASFSSLSCEAMIQRRTLDSWRWRKVEIKRL